MSLSLHRRNFIQKAGAITAAAFFSKPAWLTQLEKKLTTTAISNLAIWQAKKISGIMYNNPSLFH